MGLVYTEIELSNPREGTLAPMVQTLTVNPDSPNIPTAVVKKSI